MKKVDVRVENIIIPTYAIADYDKNPMFLEKRVYQGSSGKVYPHPVCEGVADEKTDKEYTAVFLENEYILVMLLPEIGGRVQRLYDKTNGYDAVYYNEVIKPALVGLAGPWISGGIEFNWPQHHRPSTFDPVDWTIEEKNDGSVTVWMGETEKMFHTKGMAGFSVYPDKAYLEIKGQIYNKTDRPQTFLWWANPAVAVNEHTYSVFPPDVNAVMDHGKRDVSKFPIADGVYYKVDYSPGTDISRYKNIPVPTSYMAHHSEFDFIGNYDEEKGAGLLHIADHHVSPGKKQWTWGNGDFGKAWDRNLTDENGPYIELMTGMFTDNQPDFTFLKPYEEKTFVQYFMPYKQVGAVKNASTQILMNAEVTDGKIIYRVYSPVDLGEITLRLTCENSLIDEENIVLSLAQAYEKTVEIGNVKKDLLQLSAYKNNKEILSCEIAKESKEPIPVPAEEIPSPEEIKTCEQLFLAATHLEQYRHATYSPQDYYLEGLKRDASDIRLNNGYGKYLYKKGYFKEAEKYFKEAIKRSTWKNPNPYDCEPYYNLGLCFKMQDKSEEAFTAFYKSVWDGNMQDKGYYQLACLATQKEQYAEALEFVEKSLVRGLHNMNARTLKTVLLRKLNKQDEALKFAYESIGIDALDHGAYYELYRLTGTGLLEFQKRLRGESHNYIELALVYREAGLREEAGYILSLAKEEKAAMDDPMIYYYLYELTHNKEELKKAETTSSLYCFPNRLEDSVVLRYAVKNGGQYAAYYLGNLYYDKGRWKDSKELWEACAGKIELATVYRNLSLVYYNKMKEQAKAKEALEKAFHMDETDARVFYELDQLYKMLNYDAKNRLDFLNGHEELLEKRDDLYTEYITLLNVTGKFREAYERIMNHNFHPWEGGEGKIPAQYRIALMNLAKEQESGSKAVELLEQALSYPINLGEGKLVGNLDNDIYYMLGNLYQNREKKEWAYKMAARGEDTLSGVMYYNDQPPQMRYYAAKAMEALGDEKEAGKRFDSFIEYAIKHMNDTVKIDYFAVSLPDFLIFEGDLMKKNKVHCLYMAALGYLGKKDREHAKEYAQWALELDACHCGVRDILCEC